MKKYLFTITFLIVSWNIYSQTEVYDLNLYDAPEFEYHRLNLDFGGYYVFSDNSLKSYSSAIGLWGNDILENRGQFSVKPSHVYYKNANNVDYNLTNLTMLLLSNSDYIIDCNLLTDSAAPSTGIQLRVNTTGNPNFVRFVYSSPLTATTIEMFNGTSTSSNIFADLGSGTANIQAVTQLSGYVATSGNASTMTIEMKSEVSGSEARIRSGSFCRNIKVD